MHFVRTSAPLGISLLLRFARRAAAAVAVALFLSLVTLPAFADDDKPIPPTPEAQVAAARNTTVALALIAGVAVYYLVQRHRLINGDQHPPEWGAKMNRNAILFAVVAAVGVGGATAALNRPQIKPTPPPSMMPSDSEMMKVNPAYGKPPKPEAPKTGADSKKTDSDKPHK